MARRLPLCVSIVAVAVLGCTTPPGLESGSPWPKFRANVAQTGFTGATPSLAGKFWSYQTGNGVFSSPVIGEDGTIYVGSADRTFYAIDRAGSLKWNLLTGEIIDSAALLDNDGRVYFGSGDGNLRALDARSGEVIWKTSADSPGVNGSFINWFEGNVALSPTGQLYAPNDNHYVYAVDRNSGVVTQRLTMPDQTWSSPTFDDAGQVWIGNNNVVNFFGSNFFTFDKKGAPIWNSFIGAGSVAASPLYTDDLVIVGCFDGYLRAFDAATGTQRWQLAARDHIYASPALAPDGTVVQPAADGTVYGVDAQTGTLKWTFDTSDPIRSSPAIDGQGHIYFGGGDGRLYVLNGDGTLDFSMQLIAADRNDLNSSPAIGADAIYIGGESGEVFSVPYEWCHEAGSDDARCAPPSPLPIPLNGAALLYTTPFGSLSAPPAMLDPNQPIVLSLVVKKAGASQLALIDPASVVVTFDPPVTSRVDIAGNGQFLIITPATSLIPNTVGDVALTVTANYLIDPMRTGLALSGGTVGGSVSFTQALPLTTPQASPFPIPQGTAWQLSRLALPLPTLLPSYNQIGFDSLQYLVANVVTGNGHTIAWMVGGTLAAGSNTTVIDPTTQAIFPLDVSYAGGFITLENSDGVLVKITNVTIPLETFRISAALGSDGNATAAARVSGTTICGDIPTYGVFLQQLGLCNAITDVLAISGAADFNLFSGVNAPQPAEVGTVAFSTTASAVTATISGSQLKLAEHVAAILLVDATTGAAISLNYGLVTTRTADGAGNLASVTLSITAASLPVTVNAYLMIDLSPVASLPLTIP